MGLYRNYISSPEGDEILEEARAESRPGIRATLYRKYENLLLQSAVLLPLFHDIDHRLASPKVRGLKLRGSAPYVNYSEIRKVETAQAAPETGRVEGGTIQVPIAGGLNSLDPSLSATLEQGEILPSVFETLTSDAGGRIVPWLAANISMGRRRQKISLAPAR